MKYVTEVYSRILGKKPHPFLSNLFHISGKTYSSSSLQYLKYIVNIDLCRMKQFLTKLSLII